MRFLVSNDDGFEAPGIAALARALGPLGEVWIVAPEQEQSAKSHAFTMWEPLRVRQRGARQWSVAGTPADCVYLGIHHFLDEPPDLVISGINRGSNLGQDVHYSGTVAAALEGCMQGYSGLAFSLHRSSEDPVDHWETAEEVVQRVVNAVMYDSPVPKGAMLNVNIPNVPPENLKGLHATRLGRRFYDPGVHMRVDPRGGDYYWIGGPHAGFEATEGTDGPSIDGGFATVTPLHPDLTWHEHLDAVRSWTDG
ncbi:MAG: 5'/3'-nucleotidase SurE [Deltaproteobacteria bacterium]|nr:MAG: 5'/3'-nucleotidase SurE [Deltaproteobacteria bacterium]